MNLFILLAAAAAGISMAEAPHLYPETPAFVAAMDRVKARGIVLADPHIHIRGGMTPDKARERQGRSGILSGVLENHGREWPLSDNAKLNAFIDECKRGDGPFLPVGIQVNDRDWHETIDPATRARLDYVLADTMIMGTDEQGKPRRLWLPGVTIDDPEAWMRMYVDHTLRVLDEPIDILANPTYLPACLADRYDELWTDDRMRRVIDRAVQNGVALEIQAESKFPGLRFLEMARRRGAKFAFGTNNFSDKVKSLDRWFDLIERLDLTPEHVWTPPAPASSRELTVRRDGDVFKVEVPEFPLTACVVLAPAPSAAP